MAAVRVNFGDILQAIEDKLILDGAASKQGVTWAVNDTVPQLNAKQDILLRARTDTCLPEDGGSWDLRLVQLVEVTMRSLAITEQGGGNKEWAKLQFKMRDAILSSIGNNDFIPKNEANENLTTSAIKLMRNLGPEKPKPNPWGDSVCTLEVHYLPLVVPIEVTIDETLLSL